MDTTVTTAHRRRSPDATSRRGPLVLLVVVALTLALGACSDDDDPSASDATTTSSGASASTDTDDTTDDAAADPEWAEIDQAVEAMAPDVGFLAARVDPDGTCEAVHEIEATTARPIGSQFKLFVLGALAEQIAAGEISWDQPLPVDDASRSLGNSEESGSLQFAPPGTVVTVEEAATKMISISDNTATDMIIGLVGRDAVEEQVAQWAADPAANDPFLTTREMFQLHYAAGLGDQYLATPPDERAEFLATSVDPLPLSEAIAGLTIEPRYVDEIEWFGSPDDLCQTFAGLQDLSSDPALAPMSDVLSQEVGSIGLDPSEWSTIWFKGGSEPGVLALGWLATDSDGETYVVQAMVSNPEAALAPNVITDLVVVGEEAFALLTK